MIKRITSIASACTLLAGCGYTSWDNEVIAQVKKVQHQTPLVCYNRDTADLSLGVMRNGTGSISKEDIWVYVPHESDAELLKRAAETGQLVKVHYNVARVTFCVEDHIVSRVELVQ